MVISDFLIPICTEHRVRNTEAIYRTQFVVERKFNENYTWKMETIYCMHAAA